MPEENPTPTKEEEVIPKKTVAIEMDKRVKAHRALAIIGIIAVLVVSATGNALNGILKLIVTAFFTVLFVWHTYKTHTYLSYLAKKYDLPQEKNLLVGLFKG